MKTCDPCTPDCLDKDSNHYFMCHMTQDEFHEIVGKRLLETVRKSWTPNKIKDSK